MRLVEPRHIVFEATVPEWNAVADMCGGDIAAHIYGHLSVHDAEITTLQLSFWRDHVDESLLLAATSCIYLDAALDSTTAVELHHKGHVS